MTRFKDDTTVAEYIQREYDYNGEEEHSMLCTRTLLYLGLLLMIRDYRVALERSGLDREGPLAQLVGDQVRFHAKRTEAFMKSIVLEWEDNKVVYQYDQDTGERLLEKYQGTYSNV